MAIIVPITGDAFTGGAFFFFFSFAYVDERTTVLVCFQIDSALGCTTEPKTM